MLPLDVLDGIRLHCSDWTIDLYERIGVGTPEEISRVWTAVQAGILCYEPDEDEEDDDYETTACYFLPSQRWRHEALLEAYKIECKYRHIVVGMLRGYSDDDINAYIKRNWENPYPRVLKDWQKAYDWLRGGPRK